jgi:hypothetical protein
MHRREFIVGPLALYGAASLYGGAMTAINLGMTAGNRLGDDGWQSAWGQGARV